MDDENNSNSNENDDGGGTEGNNKEELPPCIDNLDYIALSELQVVNESIERTYYLCPNTDYRVGIADLASFGSNNGVLGGQLPIAGRSNLRVLCGYDGSSQSNCTIRDGSFGLVLTNGWTMPNSVTQDNVHIQGVSFFNVTNAVSIYSVANVTVEECVFEVRTYLHLLNPQIVVNVLIFYEFRPRVRFSIQTQRWKSVSFNSLLYFPNNNSKSKKY